MDNKIDRRQFLQGVAGAVLVPTLMTSALSKCFKSSAKPCWKAAFWDGNRFVSKDQMGAPSVSGAVRVSISGQGAAGDLKGVNLQVPVSIGGESTTVPFHAWTANSPAPTRFTAHIHEEGLTFEVLDNHGSEKILLSGVKPGTYVLARSFADMDRVANSRGLGGEASTAAAPCHVLVEIAPV